MKKHLLNIFKIKERNSSISTEILAGFTTFSSMAYVLVVNPSILSDAGMPFGAVMVATIITTALATILMAFLANFPFAIAPGIGVSAFFTYSIVLKKQLPWQDVLTATWCVALLLCVLTAIKLRRKILSSIPPILIQGITCGVGFFLIFVGLKQIKLIEASHGAFINLGHVDPFSLSLVLISYFALLYLLKKGVNYAFILVIIASWLLGIACHKVPWKGIIHMPPSLEPTLWKLHFPFILTKDFPGVIFSLFLVSLFDSTAGLLPLLKMGGYIHDGRLPKEFQRALIPDCVSSLVGTTLGTGILAVHLESASGLKIGGKTGLCSLVVALLFLLCLFFYPLFSSIPEYATAPVLMTLGTYMIKDMKHISWKDLSEIIPFFLIVIIMPLTFSIYLGFALGFLAYVILKCLFGKIKQIPIVCWIFGVFFAVELLFL